nr:sugar phosphate isomerase/epimerase [Bacteroidota bacterium]
IQYNGPLSVEWEDSGMDREEGAREACQYVKNVDFNPSKISFDSAFE